MKKLKYEDLIYIYVENVDSCEVFPCKCSNCNNSFIIGCSDIEYVEFCPMCGEGVRLDYVGNIEKQ